MVNVHTEIALFTENTNLNKKLYLKFGTYSSEVVLHLTVNFAGLVGLAQIVERALRMREVAGAMPASSTKCCEDFLTFSDKRFIA